MDQHVHGQVVLLRSTKLATIALVWLLPGVPHQMLVENKFDCGRVVTVRTLVWPFASVSSHVPVHVPLGAAAEAALGAHEWLFTSVTSEKKGNVKYLHQRF